MRFPCFRKCWNRDVKGMLRATLLIFSYYCENLLSMAMVTVDNLEKKITEFLSNA